MKAKDVLKKLDDIGYKVSRQWLYVMGKRVGFINEVQSTGDIVFNEVVLNDFIETLKKEKKERLNYTTIKEASEKTKIPISYYYKYLVLGEEAGFKRFGYGIEKNKWLINIEKFNEFIKKRNFGYPKKWEKVYD